MTSSMPCVPKSRFHTGFLWCVLVLSLRVTSCAQIRYTHYKRVDTTTAGLVRATNVAMETTTLAGCAVQCSKSPDCSGIAWDSVSASCTIGVLVNSSAGASAPKSSRCYVQQGLKCRFDLGYEMRAYNDTIRCLRISSDELVYHQASQNCSNDGGRLYKANSLDLLDLVLQMIKDKGLTGRIGRISVGLTDMATEDHFVWSDGEPMTRGERDDLFREDQPDNRHDEDCVYMIVYSNGRFNDAPCDNPYRYLCEIVL